MPETLLSIVMVFFQGFFIFYFIGLHGGYLLLNINATIVLFRYMQEEEDILLPKDYLHFELPISVLVPAYNEEASVVASVRSLLQLNYSEFEIIVINDGSKDSTLDELIREFKLSPFPDVYHICIPTKPVNNIYHSKTYPNLRVIDKENGGKSDALNAGINVSNYPLFCGVDADSILQRDSLQRVVQPFLEDDKTVAAGGTVRIANGCQIEGGFLVKSDTPKNVLALIQVAEYLRSFLFGRMGWAPMNALLIISGAFGLFKKDAVILAGGYHTNTIGEDMELVVRLHRIHREKKLPYKITFLPDPICWTEAPESIGILRRQRVRWQQGLSESLFKNISMLFGRSAGLPGWLAFPFFLVFEWFGPIIEVSGFIFFIIAFCLDIVSLEAFTAFLLISIGFGLLISVSALLLETISFHVYTHPRQLLKIFFAVIVENFGYRQLNALWRMEGLIRWFFGKSSWGEMTRKGIERKD